MNKSRQLLLVGFLGAAVVLSVISFPAVTLAAESPTANRLVLVLELSDNSIVIGAPTLTTISIRTSFATLDVPFEQVRAFIIQTTGKTGSLSLKNGDRLSGDLEIDEMEVATIFGKVRLKFEHVRGGEVYLGRIVLIPQALKKSVVLHYSCDEPGRRVFDRSGKGNHGIAEGLRHTPLGKLGGSYIFKGDASYIENSHPKHLPTGDSDRTIMLWFRTSSSTGQGTLFSYGSKRTNRAFGASINGKRIYVNSWMNAFFVEGTVTDNTWRHLTVVHTRSKGRDVYINGVLSASHRGTVNTQAGTPFWVGRWVIPLQYFHGQIDEIIVFDTALPIKDIKHLFDLQK